MKITDNQNKPLWSVNWSCTNQNRTTETKTFDTYREALLFLNQTPNARGYVLRLIEDKAKIYDTFGGFEPSAQEQNKIDKILEQWNR